MTDTPLPPTLMSFRDLDEAESALDWLGIDFIEGDAWFEGDLDADAAELLEAACEADDTPPPVRALAALMLDQWRDPRAPDAWRVTFGG
jgi:hypothetical protein